MKFHDNTVRMEQKKGAKSQAAAEKKLLNFRELHVQRGDALHSADTLEKMHVINDDSHWSSVRGV